MMLERAHLCSTKINSEIGIMYCSSCISQISKRKCKCIRREEMMMRIVINFEYVWLVLKLPENKVSLTNELKAEERERKKERVGWLAVWD
jgi:hypothetical protein